MSALPWPLPWLEGLLRRGGRKPAPPAGAARAAQTGAVTTARFGGDEDPETEWVTVYDAPALEVAHVVKGRLEAEGLPVFLRYDTLSVVYGMTAGFNVRVQVPRALEDRALAILDAELEDADAQDFDAPEGAAPGVEPAVGSMDEARHPDEDARD